MNPRKIVDTRNKVLFFILFFLILYAISFSYFKFYLLKDYIGEFRIACNPIIESCFSYRDSCDSEGICTENYKIIHKKVSLVEASCGKELAGCNISCNQNEGNCVETLCNESLVFNTEEVCSYRPQQHE